MNTPPPKQLKNDKMNFLRAGLLFFMRGIPITQNGSSTATIVAIAITTSRIDFISVTDAISIKLAG